MEIKFDNIDRQHVVDEIQKHIGSKLSHTTRRHIYLKDDEGKTYVVLGGIDDWHGIPDEVIDDIEKNCSESFLSITLKKRKTLKIYFGTMEPFMKVLGQLDRIGNDKYTFHVDEGNDLLVIREARSVTLDLLTEVLHSESDRTNTKSKEGINKLLENMSQSDIKKLVQNLKISKI